jgi:hypothetical protein
MQYPNYMDAALKGLSLGSALGKLPREGAENATQKAYAEIAKEQAKAIQAQIKQVMSGVNPYTGQVIQDPSEKTALIAQIQREGGLSYSSQGGTQSPLIPYTVSGRDAILQQEMKLRQPNQQPQTNAPPTTQQAPQTQQTPPQTPPGKAPLNGQNPPVPQDDPLERRMNELAPGTGFYSPTPQPANNIAMQAPRMGPTMEELYQQYLQGGNLPAAPIG